MANKQLSSSLQLVKKSNALCRANWGPKNVLEPRLVALLASKIHKDDKDFKVYEIHVSEVTKGNKYGGKDYREIEETVGAIMSRVITIYDPDGWTKYSVFSRCRFRRNDGFLELGFHPDLIPHYLNLKKQFAKYKLDEFFMLPSTYSQRIYEILRSWDDQPETEIDVVDLHVMLDVPESLKKDFAAFRRRVLEKAHKDIHKYTSLHYEWEPIKQGRKVVAIRFIFAAKRAKKAVTKQITEKQRQTSKHNNKYGQIAIKCIERHRKSSDICKSDNQPAACKLCKENFGCVINQGI